MLQGVNLDIFSLEGVKSESDRHKDMPFRIYSGGKIERRKGQVEREREQARVRERKKRERKRARTRSVF